MRVIALRTLRECWEKHPETEQPLKTWHEKAVKANWKTRQDIETEFSGNQVKMIKGNRARFKIMGNNYRLIVKINYSYGIVYIRFAGTKAEYNKIDAETI
jgi:mRNA interferase HigB